VEKAHEALERRGEGAVAGQLLPTQRLLVADAVSAVGAAAASLQALEKVRGAVHTPRAVCPLAPRVLF
jgi:hypothetical protein